MIVPSLDPRTITWSEMNNNVSPSAYQLVEHGIYVLPIEVFNVLGDPNGVWLEDVIWWCFDYKTTFQEMLTCVCIIAGPYTERDIVAMINTMGAAVCKHFLGRYPDRDRPRLEVGKEYRDARALLEKHVSKDVPRKGS